MLQLGMGLRRRVTLLQSGPSVALELKELDLPVVQFSSIFRPHDRRHGLEAVRQESGALSRWPGFAGVTG